MKTKENVSPTEDELTTTEDEPAPSSVDDSTIVESITTSTDNSIYQTSTPITVICSTEDEPTVDDPTLEESTTAVICSALGSPTAMRVKGCSEDDEPLSITIQGSTQSTEPMSISGKGPTPSTESKSICVQGSNPVTEPMSISVQGSTPSTEPMSISVQGSTPGTEPMSISVQGSTPGTEPMSISVQGSTPSSEPMSVSVQGSTLGTEPMSIIVQSSTPVTEPMSISVQGSTLGTESMISTDGPISTSLTESCEEVPTITDIQSSFIEEETVICNTDNSKDVEIISGESNNEKSVKRDHKDVVIKEENVTSTSTPPLSPVRKKARVGKNIWNSISARDDSQDFQELLRNYTTIGDRTRGSRLSSERDTCDMSGAEPRKDPHEVDTEPFGKELGVFNIAEAGFLRAIVQQKYDNNTLDKAMGVELLEDAVIICNTFANQVDFVNFNSGKMTRSIPCKGPQAARDYQPNQPSQCTVLQNGQVVLLDARGISVFDQEQIHGIYKWKTAALSRAYQTRSGPAKMYGLLVSRRKQVGTYIQDDQKGHLFVWLSDIDKPCAEWKIIETNIKFRVMNVTVRFAACHGNTIALMDMEKRCPKIWLVDLDGNIRKKIEMLEYNCIQPAGGCFDSAGNLIVSDSKAKKILIFDPSGEYVNSLEIVDSRGTTNYLQELESRITDISINDTGDLIILSPLGRNKCFIHCKIMTNKSGSKDEPAVIKEQGVTRKNFGIFEEVTEIEAVDVAQNKSDFDAQMDDMERNGELGSSNEGSPRFNSFGRRGKDTGSESKRPATSDWCTQPQKKPSFLEGGSSWRNKSPTNSNHEHESNEPPARVVVPGWGSDDEKPSTEGSGWAAKEEPKIKIEGESTKPVKSWGSDEDEPANTSGAGSKGWDSPPAGSSWDDGGATSVSKGWGNSKPNNTTPSWSPPKPVAYQTGLSWGCNNTGPSWAACSSDVKPNIGCATSETDKYKGWGASEETNKSSTSGWGSSKPETSAAWGSSANDSSVDNLGKPNKVKGWGSGDEADEPPAGPGWGEPEPVSAWGSSSTSSKPPSNDGCATSSTSNWGNDKISWNSPPKNQSASGWGSTSNSGSRLGWGASIDEEKPVSWSSQPKENSGWDSEPKRSTGWDSEPKTTTGWDSEPKTTTGWDSEPKSVTGWDSEPKSNNGWDSEPKSSSGWDSTPASNDDKGSNSKNTTGWDNAQNDPASDANTKPDAWGSAESTSEGQPPKPLVVNRPPVAAEIDEKADPRIQAKKRISLSDYRKKNPVPGAPIKEPIIPKTPAPMVDVSDDDSDEKVGGESPPSPVFESMTTCSLPKNRQLDASFSKGVIDELEKDIDDGNEGRLKIEVDSDAKFSTDDEA